MHVFVIIHPVQDSNSVCVSFILKLCINYCITFYFYNFVILNKIITLFKFLLVSLDSTMYVIRFFMQTTLQVCNFGSRFIKYEKRAKLPSICWSSLYNIFDEFRGHIFQQIIGISMGTICALLHADLFYYSYESDFTQKLIKDKNNYRSSSFESNILMIFCQLI